MLDCHDGPNRFVFFKDSEALGQGEILDKLTDEGSKYLPSSSLRLPSIQILILNRVSMAPAEQKPFVCQTKTAKGAVMIFATESPETLARKNCIHFLYLQIGTFDFRITEIGKFLVYLAQYSVSQTPLDVDFESLQGVRLQICSRFGVLTNTSSGGGFP